MNELSRVNASPSVGKTLTASSSSDSGRSQNVVVVTSGNSLPASSEAAKVSTAKAADVAVLQRDVKAAVEQMNEYIQSTQRDLSFSYDPDLGETIVRVLDRSTQEVIRQIPDETFLRLAQRFDGNNTIQLFSAQA
jgi:flagellar protein FlaG